MNSSPDIKVFLIGNKADLEEKREVNKDVAEKYKNDYDLDYFIETSAKTGMNAQEIFVQAARTLYDDYILYNNEKKNKENKEKNTNKQLTNKPEAQNKKQCC